MNIDYYEKKENILHQAKEILQLKKTFSAVKNRLSALNTAINEKNIDIVIEISIELSRHYLDGRKGIKNFTIYDCITFFVTLDKILICKEKLIIDTECFELLYSFNAKKQKELRARVSDRRLPYLQEAPRCKITYDRAEIDAWFSEEKARQQLKRPLI